MRTVREKTFYLCAIIFLLLAFAGDLKPQIRQHKFGRITVADGLSSYRVYDVAQDSLGFLWVGTLMGLDRYDGYSVVHFRHDDLDSTSLSNDRARTLFIDRPGTLWVGTDAGGLNKFDSRSERFSRYVNNPADSASISPGKITAICEDKSGNLWIGILGGGLDCLARGKGVFHHYRHVPSDRTSLSDNRVHALCSGDSGRLWIGTESGLDEFDSKTGRCAHFRNSPGDPFSLSGNFVTSIFPDGPGMLWVGVAGGGLNKLDRSTGRCIRYRHNGLAPGSISHDDVSCIYVDDPGYLWVGISDVDGGLNRFDKKTGRFARFKNDPLDARSLLDNYIRNIRPGNFGAIWIVTDRGLSKFERRAEQFRHYTISPNILVPESVSSLWESLDGGSLWIGTNGLNRIDAATGQVRHYRNDPADSHSLGGGFVQALCEDRDGKLWCGTTSGGLENLDPGSGRSAHYDVGLKGRTGFLLNIIEDRRGIFWMGTADVGLLRFDPATRVFHHYNRDPNNPRSLGNDAVYALLEDREGTIWVGTEGGGLDRYDGEEGFVHFRHDPSRTGSLSDDRVYALLEDNKGRIWVGTNNDIGVFDKKTGSYVSVLVSGGPPGLIKAIVEDKRGSIWLSTMQKGLYRVDPESGRSRHYDVLDGLQGNNFSSAAFKRANGEIMFGGENGYNVFDPDSILDNTRVPPVVLTNFSIFGKPAAQDVSLPQLRELLLRHDQNFFSFEFSALDLTAPTKNMYAYRIDGVDTGWVYPVGRRYASYTNIDPGGYTLRVRGSNNDGIWNEKGLSIPITIKPPYWATWWFRSLAALLAIGIMAGAYQYRVSKLLEMERMRLRIASDLHDDIGSSLGSIALITDMVRKSLPPGQKSGEQLQDASSAARRTADSLRDIVWLISPDHDKLDDIVLRMKDAAAKLLVGIEYSLDCPEDTLGNVLDMEFRRHVWLIYKETLHNIAKYAKAHAVDIQIKVENGLFYLRIKDDGVGFDTSSPASGNGLRNLRTRAAKLGGSIAINSAPGRGTSVHLEAKIP